VAIRSGEKYVTALDGVRALAILAVFSFHALRRHPTLGHWALVRFGNLGVDAFFVLSGFLITLRLFDLADRADLTPARRWGIFLLRRTARIFPLYYATLAILAFVGPPLAVPPDGWPWLLTYTVNIPTYLTARWIGPGHFWSLSVEEQFYLLFPVLVLTRARRWLAPVFGLAAITTLVARVLLADDPVRSVTTSVLLPLHFDAFGAGILAAIAARNGRVLEASPRAVYLLGLLGWVSVLAITVARFRSPAIRAFLPTGVSVGTAAVVLAVWTDSARPLTALLSSPPLAALGRISYGFYIFHPLVLTEVARLGLSWLPAVVLSFSASVVLAALSFHFFELPILERIRRRAAALASTSSPAQVGAT
jgi:peptidoglycan/LPS O-acetylase OafA/YrhL